jgi:uncharacterized membrane protein YeaQ/YmgE (transglycosylase-associated protein family)
MLGYLLSVMIGGLIIGALGRFALPGPQPMGCLATMLVGIGGSLLAGLLGRALFGENYNAGFILSIACAALLVWLFTRRTRRVT